MTRPNILFVFSDQHRYGALGSSGNAMVRTPNLDRLAAEGATFDQAFSCYPLCSPYRAQMLTGTYCHRNLVVCNEYALKGGQPTLAHVLGRAGYRTGFVGKWHLGYGPYPQEQRHGFDYLAGYNCGHGFYKKSYHENERGPIPLDCWAPEGETSLAIRFMREHQADGGSRPFALLVGWAPPHWPYEEFPREFDTYDPAQVEPPPNVPEQMRGFARMELAQYYGCISALDAQMGRLLAEYPPESYVAAATYALAQRVYAKAPEAADDDKLREEKVNRVDLIRRAWTMLECFLTAYPDDPAADQAGFAAASALLDMEAYARAADMCDRCARRYPESEFCFRPDTI